MNGELISPRQYFDSDVQPPVQQFLDDPGCEWKARCAAVALTSLIEWIYEYRNRSDHNGNSTLNQFRDEMFKLCDAIRPVRDVADSARHRFLTRDLNHRVGTTATGVWADRSGFLEMTVSDRAYNGCRFDALVREVTDHWERWISTNFLS